jgi:hypothetical protein
MSPNFACQRTFFTLAMHVRSLTNFLFRRFHLPLGPPLHRLLTEKPHLFEKPFFRSVRLLEISIRVVYRVDYRYESVSKFRAGRQKRQKSLIAEFRRRHRLSLPRLPNRLHTPHHFESHPVISPILANLFPHYVFDMWMVRTWPAVPFERYAEDKDRLLQGHQPEGDVPAVTFDFLGYSFRPRLVAWRAGKYGACPD